MGTFFINTEDSKTNEPHRFKYNSIDKLNLKNPNKNMALANLSIIIRRQMLNRFIKTINLKFPHQHGMKRLTYQMDHIIYQLYKIISNT